jgi:hypothetical protein
MPIFLQQHRSRTQSKNHVEKGSPMTYQIEEHEVELYDDGDSMTGTAVWEVEIGRDIDGEYIECVELDEFRVGGLTLNRDQIVAFLCESHVKRIEDEMADKAHEQLMAGDFAEAA